MDTEFQSYYAAQQTRLQQLRARIAAERKAAAPFEGTLARSSSSSAAAHVHADGLGGTDDDRAAESQPAATAWRALNTALLALGEEEARLSWDEQALVEAENELTTRRHAAVQRKAVLLAGLRTIAVQRASLESEEASLKKEAHEEDERHKQAEADLQQFDKVVQQAQESVTTKRLLMEKRRAELASQSEQQDEAERDRKASIASLQARIDDLTSAIQLKMDELADRERVVQCAEESQRAALARRIDRIGTLLDDFQRQPAA